MIVAGAAGGAAWARDPGRPAGVLRDERDHHLADAQLRRRARPRVPDLRQPLVLARHVDARGAASSRRARRCPTRRPGRSTTLGSVVGPARLRSSRVASPSSLWVLYSRTRFGFEVQVIGDSPRAARYAGMRTRRKILAVMALSGAIAGLGGASQDGDFRHQLDSARPPAARATATRASSSLRSPATTRSPSCSSRSCSAGSRTPATRCRAPTSRPGSSA